MESPLQYFSGIKDPRVDRTKAHLLEDIIVMAILSVLCSSETWDDMEDFGKEKESWPANLFETTRRYFFSWYFQQRFFTSWPDLAGKKFYSMDKFGSPFNRRRGDRHWRENPLRFTLQNQKEYRSHGQCMGWIESY